jgi:hypothetical protein
MDSGVSAGFAVALMAARVLITITRRLVMVARLAKLTSAIAAYVASRRPVIQAAVGILIIAAV